MTTSDTFRQLALSFPRANERAILGSQEFRVRDKAFATLGWPQPGWAVVRLTPADQAKFLTQSKALAPGRHKDAAERPERGPVGTGHQRSLARRLGRRAGIDQPRAEARGCPPYDRRP